MSQFDHFVGTRPVTGSHVFDVQILEHWLTARLPDFEGPLTVEMFKGGQSNPTYKLLTPKRAYVMRAKPGVTTLNELARGVKLAGQVARWAMGRPSILATVPSHVYVFWKSFEGLDQPDLQCVFTPGSYAEGKVYVLDDYPGVTAGAWQHRPESIGWVRAKSADVFDDPEIQPNYLADPMDRRVHLGGIRLIRRLLHAPELKPFLSDETLPGPHVESDDELLDFARRNGSTTYHLIGTARMGPNTDPTAVVDDRLRVHGLEGRIQTRGWCLMT